LPRWKKIGAKNPTKAVQERFFHTIRIKIVLPFQSITEKKHGVYCLSHTSTLSHQSLSSVFLIWRGPIFSVAQKLLHPTNHFFGICPYLSQPIPECKLRITCTDCLQKLEI
jgi:hypothetical protein